MKCRNGIFDRIARKGKADRGSYERDGEDEGICEKLSCVLFRKIEHNLDDMSEIKKTLEKNI